MRNLRKYGHAPFDVALIHGGPGAPGEMATVARELSSFRGVLEPLQTAMTLEGQLQELKTVLERDGDLPVTLIGFSWGAMLSFILAGKYPAFVRKLILIGSPPFEKEYASSIMETRLSRLSEEERLEAHALMETLDDPSARNKSVPFAQLGRLFSKADSYDPVTLDSEVLEYRYDVNQSVWKDATDLRSSGKLLELGEQVNCQVVAFHGDHDPHPPEGVQEPLTAILADFKLFLLENCGHQPWNERVARDRFYDALKEELR